MPWPKGKPRKGHINKDGTAHGAWGTKLTPEVSVRIQALRKRLHSTDIGTSGTTKSGNQAAAGMSSTITASNVQSDTPAQRRKRYTTPLAHAAYSIEQCPNCEFPEADGGYCPECGWSQPVVYGVAI